MTIKRQLTNFSFACNLALHMANIKRGQVPPMIDDRIKHAGPSELRKLTVAAIKEIQPGAVLVIQEGSEKLLAVLRWDDYQLLRSSVKA